VTRVNGGQMTAETSLPLAGIRVLDLTSVIMGPFSTQALGDLGADVILVETPKLPTNRLMTPGPHPALSGLSLNLLRNKRSIVMDLGTERGREVARTLACSCDVVVTNLRPGSLGRLGLDYPAIQSERSDIVYCQAQGFPLSSTRADEPAYDDIIQAETGVANAVARASGRPGLVPTILADKVAGLFIAQAVLAALVRRERTGVGGHIEVPMSVALTSFMLVEHAAGATARNGEAGYKRILNSARRPSATKDGWIQVLPYSYRNFVDIFTAGGLLDLIDDQRIASIQSRVANAAFIYEQIEAIMPQRTTAEWLEFCREHRIPATPVRTLEELVAEQIDGVHPLIGSYKVTRMPAIFDGKETSPVRAHAPLPGQHSRELLSELGFDEGEIDRLIAADVISTTWRDR
jgi:crotonobetainyl-CoA:carnitine CoA-transferase CaiB-like acyl-CoA transferase